MTKSDIELLKAVAADRVYLSELTRSYGESFLRMENARDKKITVRLRKLYNAGLVTIGKATSYQTPWILTDAGKAEVK